MLQYYWQILVFCVQSSVESYEKWFLTLLVK
jgi:hypothetical protein